MPSGVLCDVPTILQKNYPDLSSMNLRGRVVVSLQNPLIEFHTSLVRLMTKSLRASVRTVVTHVRSLHGPRIHVR